MSAADPRLGEIEARHADSVRLLVVEALCDAADRYGDYHVIQSGTIRRAVTAAKGDGEL